MMKNLKIFLILFVSVLVLSITPAMAIETGQNINGAVSDDWTVEWNKIKDTILNAYFQEKDTELTPEQTAYLETHEDSVLAKGESVLYNLQDYLDYLNENTKQKRGNVITEDLDEIVTYLKSVRMNVTTKKLNYTDLSKGWGNGTYKEDSGVIVQIDDKGYTRYMQLINITNDLEDPKKGEIHLRTPKKEFTMSAAAFENLYLPNEEFNVIVVPNNGDVSTAVHDILTYQRDHLNAHISRCNAAMVSCGVFTGLGFSGIMLTGVWRCCESCKGRITQYVTRTENIGQATRVLERYTQTVNEDRSDATCQRCTTPRAIIITGIFIAVTSILAIIITSEKKINYETEIKNLGEYIQL